MIRFSTTPGFWLVATVLGYMGSGNLKGTLLWVFVIFVSVVVHELGHALGALCFGLRSTVTLVALGGITSYGTYGLSKIKRFFIIFAGPFFSASLFFLSYLGWMYFSNERPLLASIFYMMELANFVWTVLNLLPILPLDGGQMLLLLAEAAFKEKGLRYTLFLSMVLAIIIGMFALLFSKYLFGI